MGDNGCGYGRHQSVTAHPRQFERRTAARRTLTGDKKMDHEWFESDDPSEGLMRRSAVCCAMFVPFKQLHS